METIKNNITAIRSSLPQGITLVCVSKFHPIDAIAQAYQCGERDFGESRVQELCAKYEALPKDIRWHFIGHLQTNKVRAILPFVYLIQSVDSLHLLRTISEEASRIQRTIHVLLEVHVAQEETKTGFLPEDIASIQAMDFPFVQIDGVMGMATHTDNEQEIRRCFRAIRQLADKRPVVSMGMSDDYAIAIEEGSTMVRVGSSIFGERTYNTVSKPLYNIIFDLGGVLMQHNMRGCLSKFVALMGEEKMASVLGLLPNGEGVAHSLMEQYERGLVSTETFVQTILSASRPDTTAQDVEDAWLTMHAGIPADRIRLLHELKQKGHTLYMLSNNNLLHWQDTCQQLDLALFDRCFLSFEIHSSKPSLPIYEQADRFIRCSDRAAQPILFVDDIEGNRLIGERFGWKTYPDIYSLVQSL